MSFLSLFLLVILILVLFSTHACNARPLGLANYKSDKHVHLFRQDVEVLKANERKPTKSLVGEISIKQHESKNFLEKQTTMNGTTLGLSPRIYFPDTVKIEGSKRAARVTLEHAMDDTEEHINSKENDGVNDDIVVMDYAQPHRKPPIHN